MNGPLYMKSATSLLCGKGSHPLADRNSVSLVPVCQLDDGRQP